MAILITGGAGYIGSHVAYALVDAGEKIVVVDDLSTGTTHPLPADALLFVGSCGDSEAVGDLLRQHSVTSIVHLAGSISVAESMKYPLRYHQNNVSNTQALIECAIKHEVKQLVFASTASIYGEAAQAHVTEDAPARPLSPYGQSKLLCEQMLQEAASSDFRFAVLRFFNVAGADRKMRTGQLVGTAMHLVRRATQTAIGAWPHLDVYGTDYATPDGTCIRDYIHVADAAQACIDALHYLRAGGAPVVLNCGNGRGSSVFEVIRSVKRVSGVDFPVILKPRRAGDPASVVASPARARAIFGWEPKVVDLDEIVRDSLTWELLLKTQQEGPKLRSR